MLMNIARNCNQNNQNQNKWKKKTLFSTKILCLQLEVYEILLTFLRATISKKKIMTA